MKIIVKFPTRSRPEKALQVLRLYQKMASGFHEIIYRMSIDNDDQPSLDAIPQFVKYGASVATGRGISKVEACNRDLEGYEGDILVLISDDMIPVVKGWDDIIALAMAEHYPDGDGCLHFNDGHAGANLCTLPIMGWKRYKAHGCIYHPEYLSLFCDNEWTEVHKPFYIDRVIIEHQHIVYGGAKNDKLNIFNESLDRFDRATIQRRRKAGFPHKDAQPWLTIGICTVPGREVTLKALLYNLNEQVAMARHPVEIRVLHDDGSAHTGTKRQQLIQEANGKYIAQIDDDDQVSIRYIERILDALEKNPNVDSIGFHLEMTTNGMDPRKATHELTDRIDWYEEGMVYHRTPGHLNPIRIDLARRTGYKDMTHAEDMDFCQRLFPLLKTSVMLDGDPMYFYLYVPPENRTARGKKNKPEAFRPVATGPAVIVHASRKRPVKGGLRF